VALIGAVLLVFTIYIRPQEFVPGLESVGLLNIVVAIATIGIAIAFGSGKIRTGWSPQLPFLGAFLLWCVIVTLIKAGVDPVLEMKTSLLFSTIFMFIIMYAGRVSFASFRALAVSLLVIAISLAAVGIHMGSGSLQCIVLEKEEWGGVARDQSRGEPDGRPCESRLSCYKDGQPDREYACEKAGLFKTFSVAEGRVRWRGTLGDPNELSMAIAAGMAFVFAVHELARRKIRHLMLVGTVAAIMYCIVLTSSRGGQLVLLTVVGVYFIRRYRGKGLVLGAAAALPLLLFGGRSDESAESSSLERLGALYDGVDLFRSAPILGLGQNQFIENYFITAHNSYLLAAAELGFPGLVIWSSLMYVSMKIPFTVATRTFPGMDPRLPAYGRSLLVSFLGICVGIFFLSFCYHTMLFVYFGMSGALYSLAKNADPRFDVKVSGKEIAYVAGVDLLLMTWLFVYTRYKGNA
jgi:O-antigen ligase